MRDDLLEAQSAVDWAKSHVPSLQNRIDAWFDQNFTVYVREAPLDCPYDFVVVRAPESPLDFSIEAGAYINTIRSSLDILACALARREPITILDADEIYFPIASNEAEFLSRKGYKGAKFVAQVSGTTWQTIKSHRPYQGGNMALYAMHRLDITRKHHRLLNFGIHTGSRLSIANWEANMIPLTDAQRAMFIGRENETLFGGWTKGGPKPQFQHSARIVLREAGTGNHHRLISQLEGFANCASDIIRSFDFS